MDIQPLETLKVIGTCAGSVGGLIALGCVYKGFFEGENCITPFLVSSSIGLAGFFTHVYANEKLEDRNYEKIAATCVKITERVENHTSCGITPVTGISMGSGNVVVGHAISGHSSSVPYLYFYFDTDNNPETIEYIGKVENSPQNVAKGQNAGIKVGKNMTLYQWKQFVHGLERVN